MIQGGCADFVKVTLLRAEKLLAENEWGGIVSIVHDEVIFELREEVVEEAAPRLMEVLEGTDILGYPFAVDCKIGDSYGEMVKLPLQEKVPL